MKTVSSRDKTIMSVVSVVVVIVFVVTGVMTMVQPADAPPSGSTVTPSNLTLTPHTPTTAGPPPEILINPGLPKQATTIGKGEWLALCTSDESVQFDIATANPADVVSLSDDTLDWGDTAAYYCVYVVGEADGTATIRATNAAGGAATIPIIVSHTLAMIPRFFIELKKGEWITITMESATPSTTWEASADKLSLSSNTGQTVTITGLELGCWYLTATEPKYGTGIAQVCIR